MALSKKDVIINVHHFGSSSLRGGQTGLSFDFNDIVLGVHFVKRYEVDDLIVIRRRSGGKGKDRVV